MSNKNNNLASSLISLIKGSSRDKHIKDETVINAIKKAYQILARKKYGMDCHFEAVFNRDIPEFIVYQYKTVVEEVRHPNREMSISEAKELSEDATIGEDIGVLVELEIKRNDVSFVKQCLMNEIRQAERQNLVEEYENRVGKIVSGTIRNKNNKGDYFVDLGLPQYPAILYKNQQLQSDDLFPGKKINAYLLGVNARKDGPEVKLSRTSHLFVVKMLEDEFPEFKEGSLEVVRIAREAGERTKVVVRSTDGDVDVMKTVLKDNAYRLNQIRDELLGEKINIIEDSVNEETLLQETIKPGVVSNYIINEDSIDLVGPEDDSEIGKLIGKRGSNLKLIASIMGKKVNVISRSKLKEKIDRSVEELAQIEGVTDVLGHSLVQRDIFSVEDLVNSKIEEIVSVFENEEKAETVKDNAKSLLKDKSFKKAEDINIVESYSFPKKYPLPKKEKSTSSSDAEMRLREELRSFNLK